MEITDQVKLALVELKAILGEEKKLDPMASIHATMIAADHTYGCACVNCLIFFAETTGKAEWEDGEFGPFGRDVLSTAREMLGLTPIPGAAPD